MVAAVLALWLLVTSVWNHPAAFNFKRPKEWSHWKQRFEQFCLASGLSGDEESRQVSTLLFSHGEEGEDTLLRVKCNEKAKKKYSKVMGAFDAKSW